MALGATGEWARLALEASVAAAVSLWAIASRPAWRKWAWPAAALIIALLQIAPLPDRLLMALAPISAGAWKVALAGDANAWGSVSVTPAATLVTGYRLFLGLALIQAITDLARRREYRIAFIASLSAVAVAILATGLIFPVDRRERVMLGCIDLKGPIEWWRTPLAPPAQSAGWAYLEEICVSGQCYQGDLALIGGAYGCYICCNKFAGAVCLTLPVLLAAFLFFARSKVPAVVRHLLAAAVFLGALWILAVTISSRAGAAALLGGGLTLAALTAAHRPLQIGLGTLVGCYGAAVLAFTAIFVGQWRGVVELFPGFIQEKLAPLLADGRVLAAAVAARMFRASPILGTGLGSYEDLCPRMMGGGTTWYYAHNDYAQAIAEAGVVGLAFLVPIATWLGRQFSQFCRQAVFPGRILDAGPWAALVAIGIHSLFDWNMHVPANAFLTCVICGLALASVREEVPKSKPQTVAARPAFPQGWGPLLVTGVFVAVCMGALLPLGRDAFSESVKRRIREAIVADRLAIKEPTRPSAAAQLLGAAAAGDRMLRWAPRDAQLHALLARANVHLAGRASQNDLAVSWPVEDYLETASRHSRIAMRCSPIVRGLPNPAAAKPKHPAR
jgi:O-antigen ligase